MINLVIKINIEKIIDIKILKIIKQELEKKKIKVEGSEFISLSISNTLDTETDVVKLTKKWK